MGIERFDRNSEGKSMGPEYPGEIKIALKKTRKDPSHYLEISRYSKAAPGSWTAVCT